MPRDKESVSKAPQSASSTAPRSQAGPIGRADYVADDDRPFAEIRKNINDALRMLMLHRWMFFVPFCLVSSGAFIVSLQYPRTYTATTSFERRNDPIMMNLPMSAGAASFKYFRNTMVQDLTSVETVGEVVEELGLVKDLQRDDAGELLPASRKSRDALARSLGATLSITTMSPSELIDIIKITYTGPDPNIGRQLVDRVKKTYIRRTMEWIHEFLTSQRDYFQNEAQGVSASLSEAQRFETQLRLANPYANPADPSGIAIRISQLEMERRDLQLRRREYEAELVAQEQMLVALEPESFRRSDPADDDLAERYRLGAEAARIGAQVHGIGQQIAKLRETRGMTDEHPDIQELLESRRKLEGQLAAQVDGAAYDGPHPAPVGGSAAPLLQSERARLLVQVAVQQSKLKEIDLSLQTNEQTLADARLAKEGMFDKQQTFAQASSAVLKLREKLAHLERTVAEIDPAIHAIEQDRLLQFSEGQPARGSAIPISPKATTMLLLALAGGIAAGVIFVVLGELFDHVYRSSGQVSRSLGLPLLEAIDEIITGQDRRRLLVRRAVVTPVAIVMGLGFTGLAASMAYLSLTQPWTYQKLRRIPNAALQFFVDTEAKPIG